jgi:hypothetical protein
MEQNEEILNGLKTPNINEHAMLLEDVKKYGEKLLRLW